MFLVTSPIVINVPTTSLLAVETMHALVQWLENLNIKRNMTSMFVNKKHRYRYSSFHLASEVLVLDLKPNYVSPTHDTHNQPNTRSILLPLSNLLRHVTTSLSP